MSQSPDDAGPASESYADGWAALYELLRRGESFSGRERNCLYLNTGVARFADASAVSGFDFPDDGRGLATVDWDLDGALDLWTTARTAPRARLLRNTGTPGQHWAALRLEGTRANRDAVGARVELVTGSVTPRRLVRQLACGDGFLSQSSKWLHFGLGEETEVREVVVYWPGGEAESFQGVGADARWTLVEGAGSAAPWRLAPELAAAMTARAPLAAEAQEPPKPSQRAVVRVAAPVPLQGLAYEPSLGAGSEPLMPAPGRALLVNLWASWCSNCRVELRELSRRAAELERAGLDLVAVSVDEPDARAKARDFLASLEWPGHSGFASERLLDLVAIQLEVLLDQPEELALPTSLLIDPAGRLSVVYRGPLDVAALLADLRAVDLEPSARRDFATPFEGRWVGAPIPPRLLTLAERLRRRGFADVAAEYTSRLSLRAGADGPDDARERLAESHEQTGRDLAARGELAEAAAAFERCLAVDPSRADVLVELGNALRELGQPDEALERFQAALVLDPESGEAYYNLGLVHALAGRGAEARAAFESAVVHQPDLALAHFNLAIARYQADELDGALAAARRAHELDAGYLRATLLLGDLLRTRGEHAEAIAAYERTLAVHPHEPELYLGLGQAHAAAGDRAAAERVLETLRGMSPRLADQLERVVTRMR